MRAWLLPGWRHYIHADFNGVMLDEALKMWGEPRHAPAQHNEAALHPFPHPHHCPSRCTLRGGNMCGRTPSSLNTCWLACADGCVRAVA